MPKRSVALVLAVIAVTAVSICRGQESDAQSLARAVAPFVDGQTLAIVHVDLATFDAPRAVTMLARFLHIPDAQRDFLRAQIVPLNVLADALPPGARVDVFGVVSVSDLASVPFFFVFPLEGNSPAQVVALEVRRAMAGELKTEIITEPVGGALVTGSPQTIKRLKTAKSTDRPEVAAGFEAAGDGALTLLLIPSADARRVVELFVPNLPEPLGGGSTRDLTGNLEWLALGLGFPPGKTDVRVVVKAPNDEAAGALAGKLSDVVGGLAKQPDIRDVAPNVDELARRLAPKIDGDRLTMELTADGGDLAELGAIVLPLLRRVGGLAGQPVPIK